MNALLIYPEWPDTYWSFKHALPIHGTRSVYPPLGLLTVAAMLPRDWSKRLVDTSVRPLTDADLKWADVALVSAMLVQREGLLAVLERCRAHGLRTVVGGPVTTALDELRGVADHVVIGEAEEIMPSLVRDLERGTAQAVYRSPELPNLAASPTPDFSLIKPRHYSAMAIQYSRGCPFNCEFCDIIEIYGRRPRTKTVAQVTAELDELHARRWRGSVFLVDDNFIGNKKSVKQLLPALAEWNGRHQHPFTFFTEASVNLADDTELLEMMKRAGFIRVFLGIETPEEASLKSAHKHQNTGRSLLEAVRRIQSYGMEVMAGFIVGFDDDSENVFDRQVEFIEESAIPLAMVGLLQALPGTQLYRRLLKEGRLLRQGSGDNFDLDLNFLPAMDPKRLLEGYRSILKRIYDRDAYYQRVRRFLGQYRPAFKTQRNWNDYAAFLRSILRQGILEEGRSSYWKFLFDAATRYRHAFGTAVILAIQGRHFHTITQAVCESK
jgi:radical SAM superfamily enzyme YgiQ (UPF0313 family)